VYADPEQAQVAVTGRGAVTPIGVNTWEAQFSDARPIEVQDASVADFVKPLNPYFAGWSRARAAHAGAAISAEASHLSEDRPI
jgi:hypothetical protein